MLARQLDEVGPDKTLVEALAAALDMIDRSDRFRLFTTGQ